MNSIGRIWRGKDGRLYMQRCPKCGAENYALAVSKGECAWCGHVATEDEVNTNG